MKHFKRFPMSKRFYNGAELGAHFMDGNIPVLMWIVKKNPYWNLIATFHLSKELEHWILASFIYDEKRFAYIYRRIEKGVSTNSFRPSEKQLFEIVRSVGASSSSIWKEGRDYIRKQTMIDRLKVYQ